MKVAFPPLKDAFGKVKVCLARKPLQEVFAFVCFRGGKVSTYDGVSGCITNCDVGGLEFVVHGAKFAKVLGAIDVPSVDLTVQKGWLQLKSGSFTTKIPTLSTFDFPDIMPKGADKCCEATNLIDALKIARVSMSKDEDKPVVLGAGIRGHYVYSIDGKRVTRALLNQPASCEVSITSNAVNQLVSLGQPTYLFTAGTDLGALFSDEKLIFVTRTVQASYPYAAVDKMTEDKQRADAVLLITDALSEAINRVTLFVDKTEAKLTLSCQRDLLTLSTNGQQGTAREEVGVSFSHTFKIHVQAERIKQTLKKLKPQSVDLTDVIYGQKRMLRFCDPNYQHCLALMH